MICYVQLWSPAQENALCFGYRPKRLGVVRDPVRLHLLDVSSVAFLGQRYGLASAF